MGGIVSTPLVLASLGRAPLGKGGQKHGALRAI